MFSYTGEVTPEEAVLIANTILAYKDKLQVTQAAAWPTITCYCDGYDDGARYQKFQLAITIFDNGPIVLSGKGEPASGLKGAICEISFTEFNPWLFELPHLKDLKLWLLEVIAPHVSAYAQQQARLASKANRLITMVEELKLLQK